MSINLWSNILWFFLHKEGWVMKSWWLQTVVLDKTLESPLDCKEIKPVNPKGNQRWIFTGRTDVEAEAPIFWPPDWKSQLNGEDYDAGKDWRQEAKKVTDGEMVGWHHWLNGHEFEQAPRDSGGQGSMVSSCSPWGRKNQKWLSNWTTAKAVYGQLCVSVVMKMRWLV